MEFVGEPYRMDESGHAAANLERRGPSYLSPPSPMLGIEVASGFP